MLEGHIGLVKANTAQEDAMQDRKQEHGMVRIIGVLVLVMFVASCSTPLSTRERGALAGGAIGAGTGALIGSTTGHAGAGALIGAGVGVLGGALIGDAMQAQEQRQAAPVPPPAPYPVAAPPPPAPVIVAGPPPPPVVVAPPPPTVVVAPPPPTVNVDISIEAPPRFVLVTGTPVYYAPSVSYNYFSYGGRYYLFHNELWFSSVYYNGPWTAIAFEYVPRPILTVPVEYYRRPPGHWKKHGPPPWAEARGHEKKEHDRKDHDKKWHDD